MTLLWLLVSLLLWIDCAVIHYFLFRWAWRHTSSWTTADRSFALVGCIVGPLALLVSGLLAISTGGKPDRPAKW